MHKLILGASMSVLLASSAMAADAIIYEPAPAPVFIPETFSWTGGYVGVHAGYGWGDSSFVDTDGYNEFGQAFSFSPNGFIGGVQAGYNWQSDSFVYGIEADLGYLGLDDDMIQPGSPGDDTVASVDGGVYAGLGARLGYAVDRTLFYVKAGGVYSGGKLEINDACVTGDCGDDLLHGSETIGLGYQVGAGIEHAINTNWTVKLEYSYLDFGNQTINAIDDFGDVSSWSTDLSAHTVKVGLNYKF